MCSLGMQENVLWTVTHSHGLVVVLFVIKVQTDVYTDTHLHVLLVILTKSKGFNKLLSYFKGYAWIKIKMDNQSMHVEI